MKYLFIRKFVVSKSSVCLQNVMAKHLFKTPCLLGNSIFYYHSKGLRENFLRNWTVLRMPS